MDRWSSLLKTCKIPQISLERIRNMSVEEMRKTYAQLLSDLNVFDAVMEEFRNSVAEYIQGLIDEVKKRTFEKIMSGEIRVDTFEDMEKLPMYREEDADGSVSIRNIPEHIQWWFSFMAYLNTL